MIEYVLVMIGGSVGAVCRLGVSSLVKRVLLTEFPAATLLINMTGSFFIGLLMASHPGNLHQILLGTGLMGGFTTFSTFQMENITLFQEKNHAILALYIVSSFAGCILLSVLGLYLGGFFRGLS